MFLNPGHNRKLVEVLSSRHRACHCLLFRNSLRYYFLITAANALFNYRVKFSFCELYQRKLKVHHLEESLKRNKQYTSLNANSHSFFLPVHYLTASQGMSMIISDVFFIEKRWIEYLAYTHTYEEQIAKSDLLRNG